jgi:hypothetical protein
MYGSSYMFRYYIAIVSSGVVGSDLRSPRTSH